MKRTQEACGLTQNRDYACRRLQLRDIRRGDTRPEVERGCLAGTLFRSGGCEQRKIGSERLWTPAHGRAPDTGEQIACEEHRLLELRHVDLRMRSQYLKQSGSSTLGLADDEEVWHPP